MGFEGKNIIAWNGDRKCKHVAFQVFDDILFVFFLLLNKRELIAPIKPRHGDNGFSLRNSNNMRSGAHRYPLKGRSKPLSVK